jgi:hypothetical protein
MKIRVYNRWDGWSFTLFQAGFAIGPEQIHMTILNFMFVLYLDEEDKDENQKNNRN